MAKKPRFPYTAAIYLVLMKDDKTLLLRRYNTGYEDGKYSLIAGHMDGNESVTSAMVREAREEAGITIKPQDLSVVHVMNRKCPDVEYMDFFLATDTWAGEIQNLEPEKCDELSWFPLGELPENIIPYVRIALNNIHNKVFFSEFGY